MNTVVGTGIGISVISLFLRFAVSAVPRAVAWAGVVAGVWLLAVDLFGVKIGIGVAALYVLGALAIGWALHLTFWSGSKEVVAPRSSGNTMGDIRGNKGIITQGQTGDNKMGK
jgi:hypothetical protein